MGILKETVSKNTILYRAWFHSIRKYRGAPVRLPSSKDSLYLDGYPRSGNTYAMGYIRRALPNCSFASHLHTVAGIKIALSKGIPIFVIIRNPEKAILSNLFRVVITKNKVVSPKLINGLAKQYLIYYQFVQRYHTDINVFSFDSVIDDEKTVVDTISTKIGLPPLQDEVFNTILDSHKKLMKKWRMTKPMQLHHFPMKEEMNSKTNTIHKF